MTKFYLFENKIKIKISGDVNVFRGTMTSNISPERISEYLIRIYSQLQNLNHYVKQFNTFEWKDFKFLHFGKVEILNLNQLKLKEFYEFKNEILRKIFQEWNEKNYILFCNSFEIKEKQYFNGEVLHLKLIKKIFCELFNIEKIPIKEKHMRPLFKWEHKLRELENENELSEPSRPVENEITKIETKSSEPLPMKEQTFESFSSIFQRFYENLFIYNQNPQCSHFHF
jgi:hypothetical protein